MRPHPRPRLTLPGFTRTAPFLLLVLLGFGLRAAAETCTTQSALSPADRTELAEAARSLASAVQTNNVAALRAGVTAEIQKSFGELQYLVAVTSPKLTGPAPQVEQIYLLDASGLKTGTDAQFFCQLNNTTQEVDFTIPGLTAGRYAFAIVTVASRPVPWRLSMLLRQENGRWLLAGIYPTPTAIAGHDGLWYWTEARRYAQSRQLWDAWLFYQTALDLLRPAGFVVSSHLDKLHAEASAATPPALSAGISPETPLVLKGAPPAAPARPAASASGAAAAQPAAADLRFTSLAATDSGPSGTLTLSAHMTAEPLADPAAAKQRNLDAARSLLTAYPELRGPFQNIMITTDSPGQPPLTSTVPIADLR